MTSQSRIDIVVGAMNLASAELKAIQKDLGTLEAKGTKSGISLGDAFRTATPYITAAIGALYTAKKAFDFSREGAMLQRLSAAGDAMAESFGQDMDDLVLSIRSATNNAIPEFEAMGLANRAMLLGVAKTPEEFTKLATAAAALGQAMGRTSSEALNDIVTGVGRMSPLILDNLGIMTKGGKVFDEYAASVGKTADQLSDAEKKQILLNAALASAAPLLGKNGKLIADNATEYEALTAEVSDLTDELKMEASSGLVPVVRLINDEIEASKEYTGQMEERRRALQDFGSQIESVRGSMVLMRDGTVTNIQVLMRLSDTAGVVAGSWEDRMRGMQRAVGDVGPALEGMGPKIEHINDLLRGDTAIGWGERIKTAVEGGDEALLTWLQGGQQQFEEDIRGFGQDAGVVKNTMLDAAIQAAAIPVAAGEKTAWSAARTVAKTFGSDIDDIAKKIQAAINKMRELQGVQGGGQQPQPDEDDEDDERGYGQHGLDMIVPPGYPNDRYPVMTSSGERVIVIPQSTRNFIYNQAPGSAGESSMLERFRDEARRS